MTFLGLPPYYVDKGGSILTKTLQQKPDAVVNGLIENNKTLGTFLSSFSCVNSTPTGSIAGTIQIKAATNIRTFSFGSNTPVIVATFKGNGFQIAEADFENVTVTEEGGKTESGCTLFVNGLRLTSSTWVGSLTIACPSGLRLVIFGIFKGTFNVLRSVSCDSL